MNDTNVAESTNDTNNQSIMKGLHRIALIVLMIGIPVFGSALLFKPAVDSGGRLQYVHGKLFLEGVQFPVGNILLVVLVYFYLFWLNAVWEGESLYQKFALCLAIIVALSTGIELIVGGLTLSAAQFATTALAAVVAVVLGESMRRWTARLY